MLVLHIFYFGCYVNTVRALPNQPVTLGNPAQQLQQLNAVGRPDEDGDL